MKLRQLESLLQDVEPFEKPKVELEQYPTGAHLAACVLHTAHGLGDVEGRYVLDLGCGGGMLSIAAAFLGAGHVLGVDICPEALLLAASNASQFEGVELDFLHADVAALPRMLWADTVIMNPPFGTRIRGADMAFLRAAARIASAAIYSLHKSTTREHVAATAKTLGLKATVIAELRFDIPAAYAFHKEKNKDVAVDLWRFTHARASSGVGT